MQSELMGEFGYLIEKIERAEFRQDPFRFVLIDDFLSREHFDQIVSLEQIRRPVAKSTEVLVSDLLNSGYKVQHFPGCTTSVKDYLACYNSKKWPTDKGLLEGYGLTFRMHEYRAPLLARLVEFLNTPEFQVALERKFGIERPCYVETAIQKYLHGYEISPHPDIRKKAATYMLNINTSAESEKVDIHTHLLTFRPERRYLYDFWRHNPEVDRCWVPWDWCETKLETRTNNSIVLFAPSDDTLHAVKLAYDHLAFQRTQVYGNLWYTVEPDARTVSYRDIDLRAQTKNLRSAVPLPIKRLLKKLTKRGIPGL
ncbi:MAG TPA: hypothetical protein VM686_24490 [Polyangiaceae bacterium]|nr:hypothetical protein [Polyangiaceae bacterium]